MIFQRTNITLLIISSFILIEARSEVPIHGHLTNQEPPTEKPKKNERHDAARQNFVNNACDRQAREMYFRNSCDNDTYAIERTRQLICYTTPPDFLRLQSKLPDGFKDTFEQRSWLSYTSDIPKEQYEFAFNNKIIAACGYEYTYDQLVQYQYAEMRRWKDYYYKGFRKFIRSFPLYEDYILALDRELQDSKKLREKVIHTEEIAYLKIIEEASRIRAKRRNAEICAVKKLHEYHEYNNQQRQAIAQEIFNGQSSTIKQSALAWKENNCERFRAYNRTIESDFKQVACQYSLSSDTQSYLSEHGLNPQDYNFLHGNHLQQELFSEIVNGIEKISLLPSSAKSCYVKHSMVVETFDIARNVNEIGDCNGASKLIDLANTMVDYCCVFAEGAVDGVIDSLNNTYTMLRHPAKTLKALKELAVQLAKLHNEYISPSKSLFHCTTEKEWNECLQEYAQIAENWSNASQRIKQWWHETPTRDKIYKITKGGTSAATDIMICNTCLKITGGLCKVAIIEAEFICAEEGIQALTIGAKLEIAAELLSKISPIEQIIRAPARICLNTITMASHFQETSEELPLRFFVKELYKNEELKKSQQNQNEKFNESENNGGCKCGCCCLDFKCKCNCGCGCREQRLKEVEEKNQKNNEHLIYEGVDYHHENSMGNSKNGKSPAPKNGQRALDKSVKVKGKGKRRVAVDDGQFIIFDETSPGRFHGHARTWEEIKSGPPEYKNAFTENGLISNNGKILQ